MNVAAVIPTYNRLSCIRECVKALWNQTEALSGIIIVDNASTDGTWEYLEAAAEQDSRLIPVHLEDNKGSAGGFKAGLSRGMEEGFDAFWLVDDDALARPDALESLLAVLEDGGRGKRIVGSVMRDPGSLELSWLLVGVTGESGLELLGDLPDGDPVEVYSLPYTGMLVTRDAVKEAGLPLEPLFVWWDDLEYCLRLKMAGFKVFAVPASVILHPRQETVVRKIGPRWKVAYFPGVPPWKFYYHVRNGIYVFNRYFSGREWLGQVAGITLQIIFTVIGHKTPVKLLRASLRGLSDGFRGRLTARGA